MCFFHLEVKLPTAGGQAAHIVHACFRCLRYSGFVTQLPASLPWAARDSDPTLMWLSVVLRRTWDLCATNSVHRGTIKRVMVAFCSALGAPPLTVIGCYCCDNQDIPGRENCIRPSGSSLQAQGVSHMQSVVWGVAAGPIKETFVRFSGGSRPLQTEVKTIKGLTSNTADGLQKRRV